MAVGRNVVDELLIFVRRPQPSLHFLLVAACVVMPHLNFISSLSFSLVNIKVFFWPVYITRGRTGTSSEMGKCNPEIENK